MTQRVVHRLFTDLSTGARNIDVARAAAVVRRSRSCASERGDSGPPVHVNHRPFSDSWSNDVAAEVRALMGGYFRVPDEAAYCCSSALHRGAVLDLYETARRRHYKPWTAGDDFLAARWAMPRRQVRNLIDALEAAGLVLITPGTNRRARTILVYEPKAISRLDSNSDSSEDGLPDVIEESDPQGDQQSDHNNYPLALTLSNKASKDACRSKPTDESKRDELTELWDELESIRTARGGRKAKLGKRRAALKLRLAEHGRDTLVAVVHWWQHSQNSRAVYLRDNGYGWQTILRPGNLRDYVDLAAAEADGGLNGRRQPTELERKATEYAKANWQRDPRSIDDLIALPVGQRPWETTQDEDHEPANPDRAV